MTLSPKATYPSLSEAPFRRCLEFDNPVWRMGVKDELESLYFLAKRL
jgi:hypothetical protein